MFIANYFKPRSHPHTLYTDLRTKSANVRGLCLRVSADCPRTVRRQMFCTWTVFAFYRLGWKTAKSAALDGFAYFRRSFLFLSVCHSFFFVEFARLTRRKIFILYFIENLQSCTCLWNAHCADYKKPQ